MKKEILKKNKQDLVVVALASMIINTWKRYKEIEKELAEHLHKLGYPNKEFDDAESFISDHVIGDEFKDGEEFEKSFQEALKEKK